MKPGGFVAGVSKGGRASLGTRSCLQGLVCYTLDGGRGRKGLVEWQHKTLSLTQDRRGLRPGWTKTQGLVEAKPACPTKDVRAWMERSDRKARAAAPSEVYKSLRPPSLVFCVFFLRRYRVSHFSILDAHLFLAFCVFGTQEFYAFSFSDELPVIPFFEKRQDRL